LLFSGLNNNPLERVVNTEDVTYKKENETNKKKEERKKTTTYKYK